MIVSVVRNTELVQGDSGGPLTVDVAGQHVLIGDVSFGEKCGLEGIYEVYGDVAYFRARNLEKRLRFDKDIRVIKFDKKHPQKFYFFAL